ncbi:MAG: hypothetical protein ACI364_01295 [Coriobacteriales bacterium]
MQTFEKARELLEASGGEHIYVPGALLLSGADTSETWDLGGKSLVRDSAYHGELVSLDNGARLVLANIVLDGASGDGATGRVTDGWGGGGSLVGVRSRATLTIGAGALLQNNAIESMGSWYPESGGGVFAKDATVNMEGGTIRNNDAVWGGGIYGVLNATVNMSGGTIAGNHAWAGDASSELVGQGYGGSGGGICLYDGAQLNLSGGAISDNFAYNRGGGVSVGTSFASEHYAPRLTMTGGEISRSQAGSSGGGIYVQAGLATSEDGDWPTYGVATITAGTIADNTLTARGYGNDTFGGAGIYVNGYSSSYGDYHNGELYLTKVEVAGNEAGHEGGGYAACPTSVTKIELTNGSAFYDNSSDEDAAPEIFIMASRSLLAHSGNPVYEISPSLLGGGAYRWTFDDGAEVPLDKLQGTLSADDNETLSLDNPLTSGDAGVQTALGLATVHVTGNRCRHARWRHRFQRQRVHWHHDGHDGSAREQGMERRRRQGRHPPRIRDGGALPRRGVCGLSDTCPGRRRKLVDHLPKSSEG